MALAATLARRRRRSAPGHGPPPSRPPDTPTAGGTGTITVTGDGHRHRRARHRRAHASACRRSAATGAAAMDQLDHRLHGVDRRARRAPASTRTTSRRPASTCGARPATTASTVTGYGRRSPSTSRSATSTPSASPSTPPSGGRRGLHPRRRDVLVRRPRVGARARPAPTPSPTPGTKAEQYATAAGVTLGAVVSIVDGVGHVRRATFMPAMADAADIERGPDLAREPRPDGEVTVTVLDDRLNPGPLPAAGPRN